MTLRDFAAAVAATRAAKAQPFGLKPFDVLRRKQALADAFDHRKEASDGDGYRDALRVAEEARAAHQGEAGLEMPDVARDERRRERTLRRMEVESIKRDERNLERWKKEDKARKLEVKRQLKIIERKREDGVDVSVAEAERTIAAIPALRPRPMDPLPLPERAPFHERLHETELVGSEVADAAKQAEATAACRKLYEPPPEPSQVRARSRASGRGVQRYAPTPKKKKRPNYQPVIAPPNGAAVLAPSKEAKRRIVSQIRKAERQTVARRKDVAALGRTIACNVGLVQRHLGEQQIRETREATTAAYQTYVRESRLDELDAREDIAFAKDAAVHAKRRNRQTARRELGESVKAVRNQERRRVESLARAKAPFALTPGIFSSVVPPDDQARRRRREANLLSEWRAAVDDERKRVEMRRSANLEAYAEERASPYVGDRGPRNRSGLNTASSLVDGARIFRDDDDANPEMTSVGSPSTRGELYPWSRRGVSRISFPALGRPGSWAARLAAASRPIATKCPRRSRGAAANPVSAECPRRGRGVATRLRG